MDIGWMTPPSRVTTLPASAPLAPKHPDKVCTARLHIVQVRKEMWGGHETRLQNGGFQPELISPPSEGWPS